jgi:ADP-ribose pyrophosphatase
MSSAQPVMTPTHVVSSFLVRHEPQRETILIVQRSQHVGSYNAQWGGISGFLEPGVTPEEQAFTEIREETALQHEQVQLLKRGEIVEYVDTVLNRHWYVHPFLFDVLVPEQVKLNEEALQFRWVTPAELPTYSTVPKLWEAYQSALNGERV